MSKDADPTVLRSLSPIYDKAQHAEYVSILVAELQKSGDDAPRNIALTGHYGSGKSSVLLKAQELLAEAKVTVINLSLPSLGIGNGRLPANGNEKADKTNLIQKEIVKLLLYRRSPAETPASRFNRLDILNCKAVNRRSGVVALFATCLALLSGLPDRVKDAFDPDFWNWINDHAWGSPAGSLQWLSLLIVFGFAWLATTWVQRFSQHSRVAELVAGPAKITLSDGATSFFDEYLDEIVYFFQTSGTTVVIFEDLDRFEDPHIFETLRELNLLLNNADQTGTTPIRFVYAIRDSIFEKLDDEPDDEPTQGDDAKTTLPDEASTRRLMATNRTKFFDLVVPIVPFVSHRTSRMHITTELAGLEATQRPTAAVVDVVSSRLTDMRLIKNICNEYEIFRRRILGPDGLTELTPDRLFASMVYKNLYLSDYEKIRNGDSRLDKLYSAYRDWVNHQAEVARSDEAAARANLRRIDGAASRSQRLGDRLIAVLQARVDDGPVLEREMVVSLAGVTKDADELREADFWRSLSKPAGDLNVTYSRLTNRYGQRLAVDIPLDKLETLMGESLSAADWDASDRTAMLKRANEAAAERDRLRHASLAEALADTGLTMTFGTEPESLLAHAERLFDGAEIVLDLLSSGFIDENYTLYITQFPGQGSASAMNFVMKSVQPNVPDFDYHFGTGDAVDTDDIDTVVATESTRLFGGEAIFCREIFDHLLQTNPDKLAGPISRLAARATAGDLSFIEAYVNSGDQAPELVRRLAGIWPGVFEYLIDEDPDALNDELISAALLGASGDLGYNLTASKLKALQPALPRLEAMTATLTAERTSAITKALRALSARTPDLSGTREPLRSELITNHGYQINLHNLREILGDGDDLALDSILDSRPNDVYRYMLVNVSAYLRALADEDPPPPTIATSAGLAEVVTDVGNEAPSLLHDILVRSSPSARLEDVNDVPATLWPAVAKANRLTLTSSNVASYLGQHQVDDELLEALNDARAIEPNTDDDARTTLAVRLMNIHGLTREAKLGLVMSLQLSSEVILPASLEAHAHTLIPELVQRGLMADDIDAYRVLAERDVNTKERLISMSTKFPEYMFDLDLRGQDLMIIGTRPVAAALKTAVLERLPELQTVLGSNGATGLATWAANQKATVTPETIAVLARKGSESAAAAVIQLAARLGESMDLELLKETLNALGEPYSKVTAPGREKPRLPMQPGMKEVLDRLQAVDIVSKVSTKRGQYAVSKRYF